MRMSRKWPRLVVALGVLFGVSVPMAARAAFADTVPFQDEYQTGTLTFCNQQNQPITSGSLDTVPFVWKAVSSAPAPAQYTRASLNLYQPNQYEDPADWTGYQLTVQSLFSNSKHPVAQATYADQPLLWPDHSMPPYWNGLYEIRMFFTQPGMSVYTTKYPAAVIRVTGSTWTLLSDSSASCTSGTAQPYELFRLPKSETEVPHVISADGKSLVAVPAGTTTTLPAGAGTTARKSSALTPASTQVSGGSKGVTVSTGHSTALASGKSSGRPGGGSSTSAGILVAVVAAVVAAVGGGILLWRKRRSSSPPSEVAPV